MATRARPRVKRDYSHLEKQTDKLTESWEEIKKNPFLYGGFFVLFLITLFCIIYYRGSSQNLDQMVASAYATAVNVTDPEERMGQLEALLDTRSSLAPAVVWRYGEAAFKAGHFEKARKAFKKVQDKFPESEFAPDATEGLGFVKEEVDKDYAGARSLYESIMNKWPESPAASRQYMNIGRCYQLEGNREKAIDAYKNQVEVFADSQVARRAQAALDKLQVASTTGANAKKTAEKTTSSVTQSAQPVEDTPK